MILFALGIVCGVVFLLVLAFIWAAIAGPIQEWLCEQTLDRYHFRKGKPQDLAEAELQAKGKPIVLISDIHLDTWNLAPEKIGAFAAFLDHVKAQKIKEVYVNGDLLDIPPHPLNQRDVSTLSVNVPDDTPKRYTDLDGGPLGVLQSDFDSTFLAIDKLMDKASQPPATMVTYLTGNHDIGVEGLRFIRPELSWVSVRVAWNPAVMLKMEPDKWVYLEHGHRYDPFIWLYLRYAILQLLRAPGSPAAAQRGGKFGMGRNANLLAGPTRVAKFRWEAADRQGFIPDASTPDEKETIGMKFAKYRFRQSARRRYRRFPKDVRSKVKAISFGHTHIPDRYEFPGGRYYVNSGDWAGNEKHQCYVLIYPDATVSKTYQWRDAATAKF